MMAGATKGSTSSRLANLPAAMRERRQWLLWRFQKKKGETKARKVPVYASGKWRRGEQGSEQDRASLVDFATAVAKLESGNFDGIGFAFLPGDGLIGIDIDGGIDADTGEITPRCQAIVAACNSYTELSPSERGVHIIVSGTTETFKNNDVGVEVFCGSQFFTCTGRWWAGTPAEVRPIKESTLRRLRVTVEQGKNQKKAAPTPKTTLPRDDFARINAMALSVLDAWVPALFPTAKKSSKGYRVPQKDLGRDLQEDLSITPAGIKDWGVHDLGDPKRGGRTPIDLVVEWRGLKPAEALHWLAGKLGVRLEQPAKLVRSATAEQPPADEAPAPTWPEPLLPGTTRVPEITVDVLGDGWLRDMAAAVAAHTQTPQAMAVLSALSVLAAVLQRRFEVAPYGDDYREPLSLWTVTALGSGNRKTAVHKALTGVLVDWEKREGDRMRREIAQVFAQREVIAKRIETLKQQAGKEQDARERQRLQDEIATLKEEMPAELYAPRLFSGDITSERLQQLLVEQDERAAIVTDEGGIFQIMAGAYSGGLSSIDVFLQGHSGSSMRVDRAGRKAHIDRPALTLALALQPGILQDAGKTKRFRDSGLMARCLYSVPKSTLGTRDVRDRRPIPAKVREGYEYMVFKLLDGMHRPIGAPRVLPFKPDATEVWLDLCQRVELEIGEGGRFAHISDWASKLPGAAARVAGLLALAEHGTGVEAVPADAVQRAVRLAELLIPHAEAAFALMGAADGETDAQMVLAYIQRHRLETVARRDLQKAMEGRFRTLERLLVAIKLLQDWNVLGREQKTQGAGRPSIYYAVNPRVFVDKTIESHKGDSDPSSSSHIQ